MKSEIANGEETIDKMAHRILNNNRDEVITLFYQTNPHLYHLPEIIPQGISVSIPVVLSQQPIIQKRRLWD